MDERFGFIHEKLDIKLLILFVLRRLPAPIDAERLADLVLIDGGIGYFDYKECLAELVNTAQIAETEDGDGVCKAPPGGTDRDARRRALVPHGGANALSGRLARKGGARFPNRPLRRSRRSAAHQRAAPHGE